MLQNFLRAFQRLLARSPQHQRQLGDALRAVERAEARNRAVALHVLLDFEVLIAKTRELRQVGDAQHLMHLGQAP